MKPTSLLRKSIMIIELLLVLWLCASTVVKAQHVSRAPRLLIPVKFATYFGYELSVDSKQYTTYSDIPQLNKLRVNMLGARVGAVVANQIGKFRAFAGMYYSGANVPYTIQQMAGGVSGNIYLLRLINGKSRTLEPYAVAGVAYQRYKFFGTYLSEDTNINYSTSREPKLGEVGSFKPNAGLGVEWQLNNDNLQFLHLFAEAVYSTSVSNSASNRRFVGTRAGNAVSINIGASFGLSTLK